MSDDIPVEPRLDAAFARAWVDTFAALFAAQAQVLGDLDRQAGDGDFGANLSTALGHVERFLGGLDPQSFGDVFAAVSKGFLNTGGTSGPLFGMWFREIGKAAGTEPADLPALADGVQRGLAVVQRLGKAVVGDNTMVDAIAPAATALTEAAAGHAPLEESFGAAARAARDGAESTRGLIASRGRASYVGEVARGVLDPGAVTVALFFAAALLTSGGPAPDPTWLSPTGPAGPAGPAGQAKIERA